MNKFIAINRFKIAAGRESDFEDIWRNRETHLNDVQGFQKFNSLRCETNEDFTLFISHSTWDSKADFENWKKNQMRLEKPIVVVAASRYLFSPS